MLENKRPFVLRTIQYLHNTKTVLALAIPYYFQIPHPISKIHKEFQILKVTESIEYKFSSTLVYTPYTPSSERGTPTSFTPTLPEVLHTISILYDTIHTCNAINKNQKGKKLGNNNLNVTYH